MKVLFPMRCDALSKPGGDTIQVNRYIEELKKYGVQGIISVDPLLDDHDFEIAHLTNIDRPMETLVHGRQLVKKNKPFVISTIHHSYVEIEAYESFGRSSAVASFTSRLNFYQLEKARTVIRAIRGDANWLSYQLPLFFSDLRRRQKALLDSASKVLLLNTREEKLLRAEIGWTATNFAVVPNGLEFDVTNNCGNSHHTDLDILCVGRIEARKNQLAILEAAEVLGLRVIFVGALNRNHEKYCQRFVSRIASSRSSYVPAVPRTEVLAMMRRAKCHISASWFEVSSLVDFEAYASGCNVVSSIRGGTKEVLGDAATYCDPADMLSIKDAISKAYNKPKTTPVDLLKFKSWDMVVGDIYQIYQEILTS